jgi:hypothetical protein
MSYISRQHSFDLRAGLPWRVHTSTMRENIVAPGFSSADPVTKSWTARRPPGASAPASPRINTWHVLVVEVARDDDVVGAAEMGSE